MFREQAWGMSPPTQQPQHPHYGTKNAISDRPRHVIFNRPALADHGAAWRAGGGSKRRGGREARARERRGSRGGELGEARGSRGEPERDAWERRHERGEKTAAGPWCGRRRRQWHERGGKGRRAGRPARAGRRSDQARGRGGTAREDARSGARTQEHGGVEADLERREQGGRPARLVLLGRLVLVPRELVDVQ